MKVLVVIGILLVGISGQAFSMGHPHNMFAARKQLRAKASASASVCKPKVTSALGWQQAVQTTKAEISERLLTALSHVRPARSY
ncbi:hypothetical protein GO730_24820 [Spirosoma sp. HMF3257]|uniref:Uncharacterized protein n=1 Tax=Spirosoma telluris TaxID=2183553 RepID=A0A327NMK1_9BACT|nr:hypothetical protein [Spirosoma telluris]RAI76570.1 hypothetical protein HMF3257_24760 [Spirosoma telluris]